MPARCALIVLLLVVAAACSSEPSGRLYPIRGQAVSVAPERNEIVLRHESVAGLMQAMTMPFTVAHRKLLDGLAAGDAVEGVLLVEDGRVVLVSLAKSATAAPQAAADAPGAAAAH